MKEKDFQVNFGHWIKANWMDYPKIKTAAFELKITKTDKFYLSSLEKHQPQNLELVNKSFFFYKFPDLGLQNPFDCVSLYKEPAYVVVLFYKPRQPKNFYIIPIVTIQGLIDDGIKSFDEGNARKLALISAKLK